MKIILWILIPLIFFSSNCWSQEEPTEETQSVDEIIKACQASQNKDDICKALVRLREVGDDYIEAIKEYIDLGPYQYAILTVANMFATNRLRVRFGAFLIPKATHTIDMQKDEIKFTTEIRF